LHGQEGDLAGLEDRRDLGERSVKAPARRAADAAGAAATARGSPPLMSGGMGPGSTRSTGLVIDDDESEAYQTPSPPHDPTKEELLRYARTLERLLNDSLITMKDVGTGTVKITGRANVAIARYHEVKKVWGGERDSLSEGAMRKLMEG
ncbi:hypothetical protein MMC07_007219, partial [Pseudocyphellaria aurata]|nr:hypothetical protein [Pseudocyphellaria aurata]